MDSVDPGLAAMTVASPAADPAALIEQAHEANALAPEREQAEVDEATRSTVARWWTITNATPAFDEAVKQHAADQKTLVGDPKDNDDESAVTVNHVYRNGITTVALTVPEDHVVRLKPKRMAPSPDPTSLGEDGDPLTKRFAATLELLGQRYTDEIDFQETLEAFVQDATHFPAAILKLTFQRDFGGDPVQEERLPDEQDNLARLRYLSERFARGEIDKTSPEFRDMQVLFEGLGKSEVSVWQGIVAENIPLDRFKVDPRVTAPENLSAATWMSHDVLMTRAEVLTKWPHIHPDDLGVAQRYRIDENGRLLKQQAADERQAAVAVQRAGQNTHGGVMPSDADLFLVREVWDRTQTRCMDLVEGLEYPAADWTPERQPAQWFPFHVLVLNRLPGKLYGFSDTQLQAKIQRAINRKRTREEESRTAALPRFAYDAGRIDGETALKITNAKPWTGIPLPNVGDDIRKAIMPLVGNHEHNPAEHDTTMERMELRSMAALPEQALGGAGSANFSREVAVAAQGASILTRYRQKKIARTLRKVYGAIYEMLLLETNEATAKEQVGPYAVFPTGTPDRQAIYQKLQVRVDIGIDAMLDRKERQEALRELLAAAGAVGVQLEPEPFMRLLGRTLGEADELMELVKPDPNALVGRLVQALQKNPMQLAPEAAQALLALSPIVGQVLQQAAAQAQQQGAPGAPAAAGAPPAPPRAPAIAGPTPYQNQNALDATAPAA